MRIVIDSEDPFFIIKLKNGDNIICSKSFNYPCLIKNKNQIYKISINNCHLFWKHLREWNQGDNDNLYSLFIDRKENNLNNILYIKKKTKTTFFNDNLLFKKLIKLPNINHKITTNYTAINMTKNKYSIEKETIYIKNKLSPLRNNYLNLEFNDYFIIMKIHKLTYEAYKCLIKNDYLLFDEILKMEKLNKNINNKNISDKLINNKNINDKLINNKNTNDKIINDKIINCKNICNKKLTRKIKIPINKFNIYVLNPSNNYEEIKYILNNKSDCENNINYIDCNLPVSILTKEIIKENLIKPNGIFLKKEKRKKIIKLIYAMRCYTNNILVIQKII